MPLLMDGPQAWLQRLPIYEIACIRTRSRNAQGFCRLQQQRPEQRRQAHGNEDKAINCKSSLSQRNIVVKCAYTRLQNEAQAVWMIIENHNAPYCFTLDRSWNRSRDDRKYSFSLRVRRSRDTTDLLYPDPLRITVLPPWRDRTPARTIIRARCNHGYRLLAVSSSSL